MNRGWVAVGASMPTRLDRQAKWRALRYFEVTRIVLALALAAYVPTLGAFVVASPDFNAARFAVLAAGYAVAAVGMLVLPRPVGMAPRTVALAQMGLDLLFLVCLLYAAGGVGSGLAMLLFLPNVGAAILGGGSVALLYACASALVMVADTVWRTWQGSGESLIVQAGLMSAGVLVMVLIVQRLASRLAVQEELAWHRGEGLQRQFAVTQAVMSELSDGVVVLAQDGRLTAINRAAFEMLGGVGAMRPASEPEGLALVRTALDAGEVPVAPRAGEALELLFQKGSSPQRLRVRRLRHLRNESDVVLILEDLGHLEEQAQQIKLAAMGRLSASIAHEIRNPLAAIRHANALLAERVCEPALDRLTTIVDDNCRRIDQIVEDVLSTARRITAMPELLSANVYLRAIVSEYQMQMGADASRLGVHVVASEPIWFDAGHLRQVLLNLIANALRHASSGSAAVQVVWSRGVSGRLCLSIADDGPGVPPALRAHVFEPFFTTESRGTGLGLYLAREFCTANGATIAYRPPGGTPPLRSAFVIEPALVPTELRP